jgi:hypothetical protein
MEEIAIYFIRIFVLIGISYMAYKIIYREDD